METHKAFTLLIASLIGSILLTLAIFMISTAQKEVLLSTLGRDSQYAFYAADAGAECALFWDFRDGFNVTNATHLPQCSGQVVGESVSGISADSSDLVIGGQGYGVPSRMQFEQAGRCVIVTVTKTRSGDTGQTIIDSRGYNLPCSNTTSPRRLERAIKIATGIGITSVGDPTYVPPPPIIVTPLPPPPPPSTQCSDGIDNDGNGFIDMADTFSCDSPADTAEISFKVICTELYRQGFMSDAWHRADEEFGAQMPDTVIRGYRFLALPVVEYMKISPTFTTFISYFAIPWAQEMAYQGGVESEGSIVGKAVFVIGVPISWVVGLFVP